MYIYWPFCLYTTPPLYFLLSCTLILSSSLISIFTNDIFFFYSYLHSLQYAFTVLQRKKSLRIIFVYSIMGISTLATTHRYTWPNMENRWIQQIRFNNFIAKECFVNIVVERKKSIFKLCILNVRHYGKCNFFLNFHCKIRFSLSLSLSFSRYPTSVVYKDGEHILLSKLRSTHGNSAPLWRLRFFSF